MQMLPPPPDMAAGASLSTGAAPQAPSYGGTNTMMSPQPTGQQQMSDPQTILATVFSKMMDLIQATNLSFPGGEDKISEGMQQIGVGFNEKLQRMGTVEPQGPPIAG